MQAKQLQIIFKDMTEFNIKKFTFKFLSKLSQKINFNWKNFLPQNKPQQLPFYLMK